jgi:murein DD-endopeptidase MepM/ murein hydrolase activator NlpD
MFAPWIVIMRVSTAALYTIAALLAKDITAPAIASTPIDPAQNLDLPDTLASDATSAVSLELVAPIAPAESIPIPPAPIPPAPIPAAPSPPAPSPAPVAQSEPIQNVVVPVKPVAANETVSAKPETSSPPEIVKNEAASTPEGKPSTTAELPSEKPSPIAEAAPQPKPASANLPAANASAGTQPAPTIAPSLETINEGTLTERVQAGGANLSTASNVQIQTLSEAEFTALQGRSLEGATLARRTLPLDSLVSANLVEDAAIAFEEDAENATEDGTLTAASICDIVLNPQQLLPNGICPPVPVVENSATPATNAATETNTVEPSNTAATTNTSASENTVGYTNSSNYSIYSIPTSGGSARNYYNLSVRPPAQLSNGNVNLLFPLSIPAVITSAFGWRTHPITGEARFHTGTDIGAPQGTPVLAAFEGQVEVADFVGGYGLTVVLQHNNGTEQTLYAHLSEIFVRPGEQIQQGEVIGRVGSTGMSTGPHLHFEFRRMTQEGWTVMNAGPALEYALAQVIQSPQLAQVGSRPDLPSVFQYSGKFLDLVRVASQNKNEHRSNPES